MPTLRAKNSDACVIVYSIDDRESFSAAKEALLTLLGSPKQTNKYEQTENNLNQSDRSNLEASGTLKLIKDEEISRQLTVPVVLLANKKELGHLRQVTSTKIP